MWYIKVLSHALLSLFKTIIHFHYSPVRKNFVFYLVESAFVTLQTVKHFVITSACRYLSRQWNQSQLNIHASVKKKNYYSTYWRQVSVIKSSSGHLYIKFKTSYMYCGGRVRSRYSDCLWAGRSGDRILVGTRFSAPVQTGPEAHHTASCIMGTGSFPGVRCGWGVTLTPHPLLVPRSKLE
jgi:hypothetical protein